MSIGQFSQIPLVVFVYNDEFKKVFLPRLWGKPFNKHIGPVFVRSSVPTDVLMIVVSVNVAVLPLFYK